MSNQKFRIWMPDANQMSRPYTLLEIARQGYLWIHGTDLPMQYTGLKDKAGTEIYEGDIAKYCEFDDPVFVEFNEARGEWVINMDKNTTWRRLGFSCANMEVIGNIYENPELLA